jgi:protein O-GlcNAc transferase
MQSSLGTALLKSGRLLEAVEQYRLALRLQPDFAEGHNNLRALGRARRVAEARAELKAALRLNPDYAQVHSNLGGVLL